MSDNPATIQLIVNNRSNERRTRRLARRVARAQDRVQRAQTRLVSARFDQYVHLQNIDLEADLLDLSSKAYGR